MPEDWFANNAPKTDWFSQNAPSTETSTSSLADRQASSKAAFEANLPHSVLTPDANTPMNIARGLGRAVLNLGTMPYQLSHAAVNPVQDVINPMKAEYVKGQEELNAVHPDTVAAFGHTLAAIIPGLGPWAASLGERAKNGDIAGALSEASAILAAPHLVKAAIPEADTLMKSGGDIRDLGKIPAIIPGAKTVNAAIKIAASPVAAALEGAAKIRAAIGPQPPIGNASMEHVPSASPLETVAAARSAGADQFNPSVQAELSRQDIIPSQSEAGNILGPGISPRDQQFLDNVRSQETPQQQFERTVAQRNAELPPSQFNQNVPGANVRPPPQPIPVPEPGQTTLTPEAVNKWLGVSSKEVMRGANPGKQIIEEGLLKTDGIPTKPAIQANIQAALADAGQSMDAQLKAATNKGITIDAQTPVYDALNVATSKLNAPTDEAFTKQVNTVLDKIETRYPNLGSLSPENAHALRVEVGNAIDWGGKSGPLNDALKQIYYDLNNALRKEVPTIARTQNRWQNLFIATKASARAIAKDIVGTGTGDISKIAPRK